MAPEAASMRAGLSGSRSAVVARVRFMRGTVLGAHRSDTSVRSVWDSPCCGLLPSAGDGSEPSIGGARGAAGNADGASEGRQGRRRTQGHPRGGVSVAATGPTGAHRPGGPQRGGPVDVGVSTAISARRTTSCWRCSTPPRGVSTMILRRRLQFGWSGQRRWTRSSGVISRSSTSRGRGTSGPRVVDTADPRSHGYLAAEWQARTRSVSHCCVPSSSVARRKAFS